MFQAYYDLGFSPPTYDIIAFLGEVERERMARDETEVEIIFVSGPADGFRRDTLWPHTTAERVMMLYRVAEPICWMLPSVVKVDLAATAPADGFGVGRSLYGLPRQVRQCVEGIMPLRAKQPRPRDPSLVTITLRECEHWPQRNSNVAEWTKAASILESLGWNVVFIRDSLKAGERLDPFTVDGRASIDLHHRASLYAAAAVNLGVSNGPMWMALAMGAPVLMLKPTDEQLGGVYGADQFEKCGIPREGQIPGAPSWQRLAWCQDDAVRIVEAFEEFVGINGLVPAGQSKEWRDADDVTVRVLPNTTPLHAMENISAAVVRGLPSVATVEPHEGHAVLVGGGPSLYFTLVEIQRRQHNGQKVFALNGAARWLAARGVVPDYVVVLDSRATNAAFVGPECEYLLASQCAPEVFDAADGFAVKLWHFADPELIQHIQALDPGGCIVGGGITVGITAMALAHVMGYRRLHLYGYDSSDAPGGDAHVYAQAETVAESQRINVRLNGREFTCPVVMFKQAQTFPGWASTLAAEGSVITVHGDGLLPEIAHSMDIRTEVEEEMRA